MLTVDQVCSYIKRSLGSPYIPLELTNDELLPYITEDALTLFTEYVPDVNRIVLDISNPKKFRVYPKVENLFWVKDPDERQVLSIVDVNKDSNAYLAFGYPVFMPYTSAENAMNYALSMANADIAMQYSKTDLSWQQERNLNQVWIYCEDSISNLFSVKYTRTHDLNLSTIPQEYNQTFKDTALAYVMKSIGEIRSKYSTLNTPVNDIQIDNSIRDRGDSLLDKCKDKLEKTALIFTHVYLG